MKLSKDLDHFSTRLGYRFADPDLLIKSMTHSSLSSATREDNQRLEFLGDRVLGLVIANALIDHDSEAQEGQLAPRFNSLVRKEACAEVAQEIGLGEVLKLGRSEMLSGGRRKQAILGDAMEAVIAAVYLDGGFDAARAMILRLWGARVANAADDARDAKTTLQEWAQARKLPPPQYIEVARSGPDHAPVFSIEVRLETGQSAQASAPSKRAASQEAAALLLKELETTS
ncbi:ribonuclease 3 [Amylibacter marinus]|uniref:Ribonuclease 3 n=1 Tax=Amylibacter marinus TaxID=1475483 RepID=A0ABQ5VUB8_9RHOB|nr:ribonuclease III [Amylibacter marinus]GLQ35045.1 ribonuclease 3 [Amylibacter marinus]